MVTHYQQREFLNAYRRYQKTFHELQARYLPQPSQMESSLDATAMMTKGHAKVQDEANKSNTANSSESFSQWLASLPDCSDIPQVELFYRDNKYLGDDISPTTGKSDVDTLVTRE